MLDDLKQYITNDVEYTSYVRFFFLICERMKDKKKMHNTLKEINAGFDEAIDMYNPSYYLSRIGYDSLTEDMFNLDTGFMISMLFDCFGVEVKVDYDSGSAIDIYSEFRSSVRHLMGKKKYVDKISAIVDELLSDLDVEFFDDLAKDYKENKDIERTLADLRDDVWFEVVVFKFLNAPKNKKIYSIMEEIGLIKVSTNSFMWCGYCYEDCGGLEDFSTIDMNYKAQELLSDLPVENDLSEYISLFDRMEFESGGSEKNIIQVLRGFLGPAHNEKDVIF